MAMRIEKHEPYLPPVLLSMAKTMTVSNPIQWDSKEENKLRAAVLSATRSSKYEPKTVNRKKERKIKEVKQEVSKATNAKPVMPVLKTHKVVDDTAKLGAWLELHTPIKCNIIAFPISSQVKEEAIRRNKQSESSRLKTEILHAVGITPRSQKNKPKAITSEGVIDKDYSKEVIARFVEQQKVTAILDQHSPVILYTNASGDVVDISDEISRLEAHLDEQFRDAVILAESAIYDEHIEASNDSSFVQTKKELIPVAKPGKYGTFAEWQKYSSYRADVIELELLEGTTKPFHDFYEVEELGVTGSTTRKDDPVAEDSPSSVVPPWYDDEVQYHLDQREPPCDIPYDMSNMFDAHDLYLYKQYFDEERMFKDAAFYISEVQALLMPDAVCQSLGYAKYLIEKTVPSIHQRESLNSRMKAFDSNYSGDVGREVPILFQTDPQSYKKSMHLYEANRLVSIYAGDLHTCESFAQWSKWVEATRERNANLYTTNTPVTTRNTEALVNVIVDKAITNKRRKESWKRYVTLEKAILAGITYVTVNWSYNTDARWAQPDTAPTVVDQEAVDAPKNTIDSRVDLRLAEVVPLHTARDKRVEEVKDMRVTLFKSIEQKLAGFTDDELKTVQKFLNALTG